MKNPFAHWINPPLLAAALFLSACTSTTPVTPASVIAEIQSICGIVTTVADIAALIASQPALTTAAAFANEVCAAFKASQSAPTGSGAGGIVVVNGVPIHYTVK
jgi:hypothetical protein